MKRTTESGNGIPGVRAILCDPPAAPKPEPFKCDGLSFINNISYTSIDGIRVWQEHNTGEARFIKCNEFNLPRKTFTSQIMKVTEDNTSPKATFTKMKARGPAAEHLTRKSREEKANSSPQETKLFQCPNYGYVKSFQRFSSPQRHPDVGKHKYVLERETLLDNAMHQTCPRQC